MGIEECVLVITWNDIFIFKTITHESYVFEISVSKSSHITLKNLKIVADQAKFATMLEFSILVNESSHVTLEHLEAATNLATIKVEQTIFVFVLLTAKMPNYTSQNQLEITQ